MCKMDNCKALRNGHAADLATQGHALADALDSLAAIESQLKELPTRNEVLKIVEESLSIHTMTCSHARGARQKHGSSKLKLGKGWFEAEGPGGMALGAFLGGGLVALVYLVAPHLKQWLEVWFSR